MGTALLGLQTCPKREAGAQRVCWEGEGLNCTSLRREKRDRQTDSGFWNCLILLFIKINYNCRIVNFVTVSEEQRLKVFDHRATCGSNIQKVTTGRGKYIMKSFVIVILSLIPLF
jgi:hypothetical protein